MSKLAAARFKACKLRPYLASALLRMPMVESQAVGTMAVDATWHCYYSPDFVEQHPVEVLAGVLLHEVYHLILEHHSRMGIYPHKIAQIATDLAINTMLQVENIPLPPGAIYPEQFGFPDGKTAEEYAEMLQLSSHSSSSAGSGDDESQESKMGDADGGQSGDDEPSSSFKPNASSKKDSSDLDETRSCAGRSGSGDESNPSAKSEDSPCPNSSHDGARPTQGRSGSCAYQKREPWEIEYESEDSVSESESEMIRRQVAREIVRHQEKNREKGQDRLPGHWSRWAEKTLAPPKVDWRRELAVSVHNIIAHRRGMVDYSYRRSSRRQSAFSGVIMPGMVQPIPSVGIIVDTSGSMCDEELGVAIDVIAEILQALATPVRVLAVDTDIHTDLRIVHANQLRARLIGGGGTDLGAGFEKLDDVDIIIAITDGQTSWPERKPARVEKVIILLTGRKVETPRWAKVIEME